MICERGDDVRKRRARESDKSRLVVCFFIVIRDILREKLHPDPCLDIWLESFDSADRDSGGLFFRRLRVWMATFRFVTATVARRVVSDSLLSSG